MFSISSFLKPSRVFFSTLQKSPTTDTTVFTLFLVIGRTTWWQSTWNVQWSRDRSFVSKSIWFCGNEKTSPNNKTIGVTKMRSETLSQHVSAYETTSLDSGFSLQSTGKKAGAMQAVRTCLHWPISILVGISLFLDKSTSCVSGIGNWNCFFLFYFSKTKLSGEKQIGHFRDNICLQSAYNFLTKMKGFFLLYYVFNIKKPWLLFYANKNKLLGHLS